MFLLASLTCLLIRTGSAVLRFQCRRPWHGRQGWFSGTRPFMRLLDDIMEMKAERLEFSEMKVSKTVLGFKPTGRVCNISRCPFPDFSVLYGCVVNGLRMASEATTPYLALKYRKIGKRGFPRIFRPENRKHRTSLPQSTEVLHQKYGCFCPRSPMLLN